MFNILPVPLRRQASRWILLAAVIALPSCGGDEPESRTQPDSVTMYARCQPLIRQRLRAPSTARFPSITEVQAGTFGAPEDSLYRIIGFLDAQNAFGGTIRSNFQCDMRWLGEDNFRLVDIVIR